MTSRVHLDGTRLVDCDVLVIGGSGAAVSAAHMAAGQGARVAVASKGRAGRSGNAMMVGGGFGIDGYSTRHILGEPEADESYTPDMLFQKIVKASFFLSDQKLARQFVTDAPPMMKEFLRWARDAGQDFRFVKGGGLYAVSGSSTGKAIAQGFRETPGCQVYDDLMIVDLLVADGRAAGAVGMDIYTGEITIFQAKSVILATGGYQPHTLQNTITDMTGDGMAMALRAGARVSDLEFLLYIPTAVEPSYLKGSILPYLFTIPIFMPLEFDITDARGRRVNIPAPFDAVSGANKMKKLVYSCFCARGTDGDCMNGGLYFDYSKRTDAEIKAAFRHFGEHYSHWHKKGFYNGIDLTALEELVLRERRLAFALGNEYSNGGVVVNERMETDLPGLYAAGEVTSGLFGAFRAGDGLSEMLAHGYRAGLEAAGFAAKAGRPGDCGAQIAAVAELLEGAVSRRGGGARPTELERELRAHADRGLGVLRDEKSTAKALEGVGEVRRALESACIPDSSLRYNLELLKFLELRNLSLVTEAALAAALERKESRGTHLRRDYPAVDNGRYFYRITTRLEGGESIRGRLAPDCCELAAPARDYPSVPDYLAEIL